MRGGGAGGGGAEGGPGGTGPSGVASGSIDAIDAAGCDNHVWGALAGGGVDRAGGGDVRADEALDVCGSGGEAGG